MWADNVDGSNQAVHEALLDEAKNLIEEVRRTCERSKRCRIRG